MKADQAMNWGERWAEAWNRRDIDAILAHFDEAARFTSPRAAAAVGAATVVGKDALRGYWVAALATIGTIRFSLDHTVWDELRQELVIVYEAEINRRSCRACEFLRFGPTGLVVRGEAMYGADS